LSLLQPWPPWSGSTPHLYRNQLHHNIAVASGMAENVPISDRDWCDTLRIQLATILRTHRSSARHLEIAPIVSANECVRFSAIETPDWRSRKCRRTLILAPGTNRNGRRPSPVVRDMLSARSLGTVQKSNRRSWRGLPGQRRARSRLRQIPMFLIRGMWCC